MPYTDWAEHRLIYDLKLLDLYKDFLVMTLWNDCLDSKYTLKM